MRYNEVWGKKLSRLGFGGMRLPCESDGKIDYAAAEAMVDRALEAGINYFDTAYGYHGGQSERFYGRALSRHAREKYLVADKMPTWECHVPADTDRLFAEQCSRVQVDRFDFYLIHNIQDGNFAHVEEMEIIGNLARKREEGRIGHLGFSFHGSAELLERVLSGYGDVFEFVQLQLNYFDWEYINAKRLHEIARAHGKPIVVMEPVRGGMLASLSPEADAVYRAYCPDLSVASYALRYAMQLPGVMVTLSGMSNREQLEDNLKNADLPDLTEKDYAVIGKALDVFRRNTLIPCTGCRYCMDCTVGLDIPGVFRAVNDARLSADAARRLPERLPGLTGGKECIACGKCVPYCPQHIEIPARMAEIAASMRKE